MELSISKFIKENANWKVVLSEPPYSLEIKEDDNLILIKYNQIKSDFTLDIVREARGIVFDSNTLTPVCIPFFKFFNFGEPNAYDIKGDITVTEKVDGSILKVFFHNGWKISTNGTIDAFKCDLPFSTKEIGTFGDLFQKVFRDWIKEFDNLSKDFTYMFEIVSPQNRVVVPYKESNLYLIGIRNNFTLEEIDIYSTMVLNDIKRPKRYAIKNIDDVILASQALPFSEEGYVVNDKDFNRIKIKSPLYLKVHRLRGESVPSEKRILSLVATNEQAEFLAYFPEYRDIADNVKSKYDSFVKRLKMDMDVYNKEHKLESRKEIAIWATKECLIPGFIFSLLDNKIKDEVEFVSKMNDNKLFEYVLKE